MVSFHVLGKGRERKEGRKGVREGGRREGGEDFNALLKHGLRENVLRMVSLDIAPANRSGSFLCARHVLST